MASQDASSSSRFDSSCPEEVLGESEAITFSAEWWKQPRTDRLAGGAEEGGEGEARH